MKHTRRDALRILAIDPCHRGVGFVVLESPHKLVDWGVKRLRTGDPAHASSVMSALLRRYRPEVLAVENIHAPECRRGSRAKSIVRGGETCADAMRIEVGRYGRKAVYDYFSEVGAHTKYQIAAAVSIRFPALARELPPVRKPWMAEDPRMSLFDAAATALTCYEERRMAHIPF